MQDRRTQDQATPFAPVGADQRIETLDVLRGFALLGILLMNMEAFVGPIYEAMSGVNPRYSGLDRTVDALVYLLVQGKFYTLFALLFGMGFALMAQRAAAARRPFAGFWWRRELALLGIGLVHALLLWSGDILVLYALVSLPLLAFREVEGRWLAGAGIVVYLGGLGLLLLFGLVGTLLAASPEAAAGWHKALAEQAASYAQLVQGQREAFGHGSFLDATVQRARDLWAGLGNLLVLGALVLGAFLLGAWWVKSGAVTAPQRFPRLYARLRWAVLGSGLALVLASFAIAPSVDATRVDLPTMGAYALATLGSALMALGYLAWLLYGLQRPAVARVLHWLAPAGRMALSNYLLQSLLCTWVFYGYGLGYFERLPRAWQVPFALALFAAQVLLSRCWLAWFRFGPAEWLWRSLSYGRRQPMRRARTERDDTP